MYRYNSLVPFLKHLRTGEHARIVSHALVLAHLAMRAVPAHVLHANTTARALAAALSFEAAEALGAMGEYAAAKEVLGTKHG